MLLQYHDSFNSPLFCIHIISNKYNVKRTKKGYDHLFEGENKYIYLVHSINFDAVMEQQ
jgi:hypothetical protein